MYLFKETYWRIPSDLHFETIRKRREIIIKAVNKELIIDGMAKEITNHENAAENELRSEKQNEESSDDDDLFDNLRKMRDNSENYVVKSSNTTRVETTPHRKRSRSFDPEETQSKAKMQKIDEDDEIDKDDDDDILSFAKKTLQHEEFPDTEDILSDIRRARSTGKGSFFDNFRSSFYNSRLVLFLY